MLRNGGHPISSILSAYSSSTHHPSPSVQVSAGSDTSLFHYLQRHVLPLLRLSDIPSGIYCLASFFRFSPRYQRQVHGHSTRSGSHDGCSMRMLFVTVIVTVVARMCLGVIEIGRGQVYSSSIVGERVRRSNVQ